MDKFSAGCKRKAECDNNKEDAAVINHQPPDPATGVTAVQHPASPQGSPGSKRRCIGITAPLDPADAAAADAAGMGQLLLQREGTLPSEVGPGPPASSASAQQRASAAVGHSNTSELAASTPSASVVEPSLIAAAEGLAASAAETSEGPTLTPAAAHAVAAGATDFQGANEQPPADVQEQGALQGECAKSSAAPAPAEAAVSLEGSDVQIENFFDKVVTIGCDRVRLLHPIGQGSYGSVYKGQLMKQGSSDSAATADASKGGASSSSSSSSAGQYVAVKVFPACKEPPGDKHSECGCCLSFQRERNALQLLRREVGVVQLQAVGAVMHLDPAAAASCGNRIDGSSSSSSAQRQRQEQLVRRPCLVMELADGTLESDVRHSEQEVCVLMVPPLKGLTVMQSCAAGRSRNAKVVHRDIKPANILRTAAGPKICDFSNCAIWRGQALRCLKMETVVGTPLYMPVEMRDPDGKCYTSDVDCHSMGLVALALLLGGSAALEQRVRSHWSRTVEGWLADFYDYEEVPLEQGISSQARDFVRCCCLLRQRAQQLLQHEWLREARVAARASQHGAAEG